MQCWRKVCSLWNDPSLTKLQTAIDIADNTKHFMPLINIAHVPNEEVDSHTAQWLGYGLDDRRTIFFLFSVPSRSALRLTQPSIENSGLFLLTYISLGMNRITHVVETECDSTHTHQWHRAWIFCVMASAVSRVTFISQLVKKCYLYFAKPENS